MIAVGFHRCVATIVVDPDIFRSILSSSVSAFDSCCIMIM